jgi:glycosyltransferase involved in cell wall biosynthesis
MIDIVIPNYNKVEFIEECIQSLRNQSFSDWRCIVVDGYSDDGSWEVLQTVAEEDDRFELHQLERIGLYKSWNYGLGKVENPYFAVLTSDDVWDPQWLEVAVDSLEEHEHAIAAAGRTKYLGEDGQIGSVVRRNSIGESLFLREHADHPVIWEGLDCSIAGYFLGTIFNSIHSFVARSSLLDDLMLPTDVGTAGDLGWSTRIGLHGDIVYCPNVELYWRVYDEQASGKKIEERGDLRINIMTMLERIRPLIAERLSRTKRERFLEASEYHIDEVLSFFFMRPPTTGFRRAPLRAVRDALRSVFSHPGFFIGEILHYILGRERYTIHQRANLARSVIEEGGYPWR